ncbi:MAG: anthranilate synthase component I family protein, partial [Acidobacteriota bacterium]|nr:anthranilate synthase component I family protein [Acidobacteriota bacterium]
FLEGEEKRICAETPEQLPGVLAALDEIAASGNPNLLAAGFISYEAGVFLEGSAALARPHEFLPFAEFSVFDTRQAAASGPAPTTPAASSLPLFTFKERATAQPSLSSNEWGRGVEAIRDAIARGDVYQVNLSRRTRYAGRVDPFALADALYADNAVPYAVTLASRDWAVVSNSPELFLDVDLASRRVVTKPIKGTIARAPDEEGDAKRRADLLASAKDAAENVMIVDLLRNDLGKVAEPGSVETTELRVLRSFRHLHHLESTVQARLRPGIGIAGVLGATLPGGSITGAPKRAALGFIRGLEPVARGAYCGAAGYVRGDGRAVFNVAIRTAIASRDTVDYHAGGGIVWDSRPDAEWREMETKSREFGAAMGALAAGKVKDGR